MKSLSGIGCAAVPTEKGLRPALNLRSYGHKHKWQRIINAILSTWQVQMLFLSFTRYPHSAGEGWGSGQGAPSSAVVALISRRVVVEGNVTLERTSHLRQCASAGEEVFFSQKCTEEENCSIKIPSWQHHCVLELFLPPITLRHSNARKESLSFQTLFDIEVWSLGSWTALHCNISDVLFSHCCFKPSWERPFSFAWA